ncbi:MAG: M56 family metallopeptidase, partial [Clostridia bacterium]|nr:M56 family metallopeptidase [Clostridia bacterium]
LARLLLRKAPKKYSYILWSAVFFRLCCPITLDSFLSVFNLGIFDMTGAYSGMQGSLTYVPADTNSVRDPQISLGLSGALGEATTSSISMYNWYNGLLIMSCIWFVGVIVLLLRVIFTYTRSIRAMSNAVLAEENVYESDRISSPFVFGLIKPRIYIPMGLEGETREYVLAHERYHIKRKDYIIKALAYILLSIHWINPLCHIAFYMMSKDMEMSCDEHIVSCYPGIKKPYSNALLSFATDKRANPLSPLAFGETSAKSRIKNVLAFKNPARAVTVAAISLCVIAIAAFATNPIDKYYFSGVYKLQDAIYISNSEIYESKEEYAVELTDQSEATAIGINNGEAYIIQRKGILPIYTLNEYGFDYYFSPEDEGTAREIRLNNKKAWLMRGDFYILLQNDGKLYFVKLYIEPGKGEQVAYIAPLKKISGVKYTDTPFADTELKRENSVVYNAYIPIKFETDFTKIELSTTVGYFMVNNVLKKTVTIDGTDTVYWVVNDILEYSGAYYGSNKAIEINYYSFGKLVDSAYIAHLHGMLEYVGDSPTVYTAPYMSENEKYTQKNMFIIKN